MPGTSRNARCAGLRRHAGYCTNPLTLTCTPPLVNMLAIDSATQEASFTRRNTRGLGYCR
jgi:hypothetical protein